MKACFFIFLLIILKLNQQVLAITSSEIEKELPQKIEKLEKNLMSKCNKDKKCEVSYVQTLMRNLYSMKKSGKLQELIKEDANEQEDTEGDESSESIYDEIIKYAKNAKDQAIDSLSSIKDVTINGVEYTFVMLKEETYKTYISTGRVAHELYEVILEEGTYVAVAIHKNALKSWQALVETGNMVVDGVMYVIYSEAVQTFFKKGQETVIAVKDGTYALIKEAGIKITFISKKVVMGVQYYVISFSNVAWNNLIKLWDGINYAGSLIIDGARYVVFSKPVQDLYQAGKTITIAIKNTMINSLIALGANFKILAEKTYKGGKYFVIMVNDTFWKVIKATWEGVKKAGNLIAEGTKYIIYSWPVQEAWKHGKEIVIAVTDLTLKTLQRLGTSFKLMAEKTIDGVVYSVIKLKQVTFDALIALWGGIKSLGTSIYQGIKFVYYSGPVQELLAIANYIYITIDEITYKIIKKSWEEIKTISRITYNGIVFLTVKLPKKLYAQLIRLVSGLKILGQVVMNGIRYVIYSKPMMALYQGVKKVITVVSEETIKFLKAAGEVIKVVSKVIIDGVKYYTIVVAEAVLDTMKATATMVVNGVKYIFYSRAVQAILDASKYVYIAVKEYSYKALLKTKEFIEFAGYEIYKGSRYVIIKVYRGALMLPGLIRSSAKFILSSSRKAMKFGVDAALVMLGLPILAVKYSYTGTKSAISTIIEYFSDFYRKEDDEDDGDTISSFFKTISFFAS